MLENTSIKKLLISFLLAPVTLYFEPYPIKALGILVVIDIIVGLMAARKQGHDITSRRLFRKIPIVGLFLIALVAAKESSPLLHEFGIEPHQAGKWLCSLYGVYELLSILEGLGTLGLPWADKFAKLLKSKVPDDLKHIVEDEKSKP